jgi:hypothetical protein
MRALAWVVLGCGCNQVFGLNETVAQQFDAPIDAPFTCPAAGTQPAFTTVLNQAIAKNCISYTTSVTADRAAAYCVDIDAIADGVVDGIPERATLTPADQVDWPRLSPEGDELWVRRRTPTTSFAIYQYVSAHNWRKVRDLALGGVGQDDIITTPSKRIGGARRFVRYAFGEFRLYEYSDDGTTPTMIRTYDAQALGVYYVQFPNLDADGLRLVFVGQSSGSTFAQTFYADRASIDEPFTTATPLATAPVAYDPFLSADCGRLYTSGLGSIFFAQQL